MKVFGISGWSGSGKTTLVTRLLPELIGRGLKVSTIKHAHHGFDVDRPGKDSHRHREAGATEVVIGSAKRWALMHEIRGDETEPPLSALLAHMSPVDLVLAEGYKAEPHDKLVVHRQSVGKPPLWRDPPYDIVAIATDGLDEEVPVPVLDLDDIPAIADFIIRHAGLAPTLTGA